MAEAQLMMDQSVEKVLLVALCVIVARKKAQSPWADYIWQPVGVVLDAPANVHGKILQEGDGWVHYFAECDPLELHRKDAPAYRECLQQEDGGSLWVVLGEAEDGQMPYFVHLVTASPYEAQDYLDSGELCVEVVDMPEQLRLLISDYVDRCPAEENFIKRKQKKKFDDDHSFGQQPIQELRELEKKRH